MHSGGASTVPSMLFAPGDVLVADANSRLAKLTPTMLSIQAHHPVPVQAASSSGMIRLTETV